MKITKAIIAEITLILFGAFLVVDSLFLHLLVFAYPEQIIWMDSIIDHWFWGIIFIAIGLFGMDVIKRG